MPVHSRRPRIAVGHFPRRTRHHVVYFRIHSYRQRGTGVGDEVDPQNLGGQQRQRHCLVACTCQTHGAGEDHAEEDREDFSHIGGEKIAQELFDVVEDDPALAHRGDDGGEVVVAENHLQSFLGHLGSCDAQPMAMPMSADFRAGASLTPSPVMATTLPCACNASIT